MLIGVNSHIHQFTALLTAGGYYHRSTKWSGILKYMTASISQGITLFTAIINSDSVFQLSCQFYTNIALKDKPYVWMYR